MVGFTLPWQALPAQQLWAFTLPCRALLPAQQWWALHFHEELYLHNNSGLYTSMTSFTLFEKPTVSHFPSTSHPPPHSQFSSSSDWFMTSKSASVFTQGKDLSCGLHWNHAHAWLCLAWALVPVRPQALPTTYSHQQPTIHALYSKTSQVSFSLLIWPTN